MIIGRFKELEDYKEEVWNCTRCNWCKIAFGWAVKSERFHHNCPSFTLRKFDAYSAQGRMHIARSLLEGEMEWEDSQKLLEIIYSCDTCGACAINCMRIMENNPMEVLEALRAKAVELGIGPMPEHKSLAASIKSYDNPWSQPRRRRDEWTEDLAIKDLTKEKAEVLFYPGCTFSLGTKRIKEVLRVDAKIFAKAGLDFGCFLGGKEICCGSLLLRVGMYDLAKDLIKRNAEMIEKSGVKKIITPCAGCYKTFKLDYPNFVDFGIEVLHITEFLAELYDAGQIKFKELPREVVTYHDPCHVGRYLGVYDPPRKLLNAIGGVELREMERIKDQGWCCGAGGGVMSAFRDQTNFASKERIEEAKMTGASTLVSACPFCMLALTENIGDKLGYNDIAEIVLKALI